LAAIPEFLARADGLPRLQNVYGGFKFASVRQYDIGLKYQAIMQGQADVCVAFSTDGEILQDGLIVFDDDKHAFPPYQAAPVVRQDTLNRVPAIATALNKVAPLLDDATVRRANLAISGSAKREPADVVHEFLQTHGLG
jgi:osmoprotectant transport system substrate-binding protein